MVVMAAAASHFPFSHRMVRGKVGLHLDLCVAVHAEHGFGFYHSTSVMDRMAVRASHFVDRMIPEIPVCGLHGLMACQTSLRCLRCRSAFETEDLGGICLFHMSITRPMAGFTSRIVPSNLKCLDTVMNIPCTFQGKILMAFETGLIVLLTDCYRGGMRSEQDDRQSEYNEQNEQYWSFFSHTSSYSYYFRIL
jgi:hypothetical protein